MQLEPEIASLGHFLNAFNAESDRGAALTATAILDEVLGKILEAFFVESQQTRDLLFKHHAPLSSLAARADACHALGLLNSNEHAEITTLRRIRNEFAHSWNGVTFASGKVVALSLSLPWLGPTELETTSSPRSRFNFAVVILLMDLIWRARLVKEHKRAVNQWPKQFHTYRDVPAYVPAPTEVQSGGIP